MRKTFFALLVCCAASASAYAQAPAKTTPAANDPPVIDQEEELKYVRSLYNPFSLHTLYDENGKNSLELRRHLEAFAWFIGEYMRRTTPWAPPADDLLDLFSHNIMYAYNYPKAIRIWPDVNPGSEDVGGWKKLLRSQNVPLENASRRGGTSRYNIVVLLTSGRAQGGFYASPAHIDGLDHVIQILFDKAFYCQSFVDDRQIPLVQGECFLDRWRESEAKNPRGEIELGARLEFATGVLYKFNQLRNPETLNEMDACLANHDILKLREIKGKIAALTVNKESGVTDEKYEEKLSTLNNEIKEITESANTKSCAELIFRYEYGAAEAVYEASQQITVCLKQKQNCKKSGEFSKLSPPPTMEQFLRNGGGGKKGKERAIENYVRQILPSVYYEYPSMVNLYEPSWGAYKMKH